jgi:hypothetical protein
VLALLVIVILSISTASQSRCQKYVPLYSSIIGHIADHQATTPAYHYKVKMTCGGCSGAINRVLGKNIESRMSPPKSQ